VKQDTDAKAVADADAELASLRRVYRNEFTDRQTELRCALLAGAAYEIQRDEKYRQSRHSPASPCSGSS
jgi:hypothetical protein